MCQLEPPALHWRFFFSSRAGTFNKGNNWLAGVSASPFAVKDAGLPVLSQTTETTAMNKLGRDRRRQPILSAATRPVELSIVISIYFVAVFWCGRPESNRHRPVRPYGFSYPLRLSPPCASRFGVWTIPSPSRDNFRHPVLGAARLVSTPSRRKAGLARDCHKRGFPDFERFYSMGFPAGALKLF